MLEPLPHTAREARYIVLAERHEAHPLIRSHVQSSYARRD